MSVGKTGTAPRRAVKVDPRLRARRVAVQRELGRRRLRLLLGIAAVPALLGAAYLLVDSAMLDVDRVQVIGASQSTPAEVAAMTGIENGEPMVRIDAAAAARRAEALPWVESARVVRRWPGTVRIEVTEYLPAAFVRRSSSTVALVAPDGRVLGDTETAPGGLLEIVGVRRLPEIGATLSPPGVAGLASELPAALVGRVARVDLSQGVTLHLADGPQIRLGDVDDLGAKSAAVLAVLELLGEEPAEYVDVRVPSAPVVGTGSGHVMPGLDAPLDLGVTTQPASRVLSPAATAEQEEAP